MQDVITIKGAREHNLKNLDLSIPRETLTVITGPSGSGKSSLAIDTIYAEGQRRYVESLSAYARQFIEQLRKPDVDFIEGLSPSIAIDQKTVTKSPRSTVGTITEIYDYLRVLYTRIGKQYCYNCGSMITKQESLDIMHSVMSLPEGSRIQILSPIVRDRKGEYRKDREGNVVITRLDEVTLQKVAAAGGGIYLRANTAQVGLDDLFEEINKMQKTEMEARTFSEYEEQFQYFFAAGLLLLLLEFFILERKNKYLKRIKLFK